MRRKRTQKESHFLPGWVHTNLLGSKGRLEEDIIAIGSRSIQVSEDVQINAENLSHSAGKNLALVSDTAQLMANTDIDMEAGREMSVNGCKALNLSSADGSVSIEAASDIHLEPIAGKNIYLQVKETGKSYYKKDSSGVTDRDEVAVRGDLEDYFSMKSNTFLPLLEQVDLVANNQGHIFMSDPAVDRVILVFWKGLALNADSYIYNRRKKSITITDTNIKFIPEKDIFKVMFMK